MSLVALCVLSIREFWQWAVKHTFVTSPGQMACDSIALCGHMNYSGTAAIILGEKEIWMANDKYSWLRAISPRTHGPWCPC